MTQPGSKTIDVAKALREELAGSNLPRSFAKLYSQYTRLRAGQAGLSSWHAKEATDRLHDAMRLLEGAFIERDAEISSWSDSARRAGAVLEWLALPQLNPEGLPLRLLAAAVYQLANYPALSNGLLNEEYVEGSESSILRVLLKAEFPSLLEQLVTYWAINKQLAEPGSTIIPWQDTEALSDKLQQYVVTETVSSLGVLCAAMRWGGSDRLEKALGKLAALEGVLLYGHDTYSWLLAKLCAEVVSVYVHNSLRHYVDVLSEKMSPTGKTALERYLRKCYQDDKTLAWPSQITGIKRLVTGESFLLCTPTGSGKTTIAELAMLQGLFVENVSEELTPEKPAPLALYLVPSRALAAEVESNLSRVLRNLNEPPINVTGLYGGNDWGPTDSWIKKEEPTILICTYEKAEALVRFLGSLFLDRISLIIIDEAHRIQYDNNIKDLRNAESRPLRLEALGTRLFTYLDQSKGRVIALSAVASRMQNALASWVTGQANAIPAETLYRSTRQLIGRLECLPSRGYIIHYDLLDGADLQFEDGNQSQTPFIADPFQQLCPPALRWENEGPEKRLRPYLLWAAIQLAAQYYNIQAGSVLISVTQDIGYLAKDFLSLLESDWAEEQKPPIFDIPSDPKKGQLWQRCLTSCEDYFGKESYEYKLLQQGIAVHHGKMPGLLARLLVQVVQERIVHIVLATSTLTEGVNLPIETVLIASLLRNGNRISAREFSNLIGRAGRPGIGTEGRSLVLLENNQGKRPSNAQRRYMNLVEDLKKQQFVSDGDTDAQSPLAELLRYLERQWNRYFHSSDHTQFFEWLEKVAPLDIKDELNEDTGLAAIEAVDSLDSLLLSAISELEQLEKEEVSPAQLEERLREIWRRSYAHFAVEEEARLGEIFIRRGMALKSTIYPDAVQRRRLYRTSSPPRYGNQMLELYPTIMQHLKSGEEYALQTSEQRFDYIQKAVDLLGTLPKFALSKTIGRKSAVWQNVLHWWLNPAFGIAPATPSEISEWYDYASHNFVYKFNWGLGSIIALAGDEAVQGMFLEPSLEYWPKVQLPWVVFWLKELIIWGTLEPVAAYLLATGIKGTRKDAEEAAALYYSERSNQIADELLNARTIQSWVDIQYGQKPQALSNRPPDHIKVDLLRDFSKVDNQQWRVVPLEVESDIYWFDPAGFPLAVCRKPKGWESSYLNMYDFLLDTTRVVVSSNPYL